MIFNYDVSNLQNAINALETDVGGTVAIGTGAGLIRKSCFFNTTANITLGSTGVTLEQYARGAIISADGITGCIVAVGYNGKIYSAFFTGGAIVNAKVIDASTKISGYGSTTTINSNSFPWTSPSNGIAYVNCLLDSSGGDAYLYIRDNTLMGNIACLSTTDANGLTLTTSFPVITNHVYSILATAHINNWYMVFFPFSYN